MQIIKNPDETKFWQAVDNIKANNGYRVGCTDYKPENLCPCKAFIDSKELGECPCGRYIKIEI